MSCTQGARLLAGTVFVETCSQVMLAYVGQWDLFGYVLKSLKNISKHEEPRITLLRDTEVRSRRRFHLCWMDSGASVNPDAFRPCCVALLP